MGCVEQRLSYQDPSLTTFHWNWNVRYHVFGSLAACAKFQIRHVDPTTKETGLLIPSQTSATVARFVSASIWELRGGAVTRS